MAYRALFRNQVVEASLKAIREAVNSGIALGSERFVGFGMCFT